MNRNTKFPAVQLEFVQINRIVLVAEETNLFVVPALDDMLWDAWQV